MKVVVIGGQPRLRDPTAGPLSTPDQLLLQNVAQGLVRFDSSGNIVAALAERWNVSDDGLSYIFRIASAKWADGRDISAQQVARALKHYIADRSDDPLKDSLGGIEDVVAMTDRVIEIRLIAPRPNLLPLLAQPELAILRGGLGSGPFALAAHGKAGGGELQLQREIVSADEDVKRREELLLSGATAADAVTAFAASKADLVLGGTFANLPFVQRARISSDRLRFDPAAGLFGLVPVRSAAGFADPGLRGLLSQAIDRDALVAALGVPNLAARATLLEQGLDGVPAPVTPAWTGTALADRLPALKQRAAALRGNGPGLTIRVLLPNGPGSDVLLRQLARDWGALGFSVEKGAGPGIATFALIDQVAPSSSPAWFVRHFRCGEVVVCNPDADKLMDAARTAPVAAQRYALLGQAATLIDDAQAFIPLTAPIRWSLVSKRIQNFAGNRYARHTLTDLERKPGSEE